jgi:hypothetical protein
MLGLYDFKGQVQSIDSLLRQENWTQRPFLDGMRT